MKPAFSKLCVAVAVCALLAAVPTTFSGCDNKEKVLDVDTPGADVTVEKDRDTGAVDIDVEKDK